MQFKHETRGLCVGILIPHWSATKRCGTFQRLDLEGIRLPLEMYGMGPKSFWDSAFVILLVTVTQYLVGRTYTGSQVPSREDSRAPGLLSVAAGTCNPQFFAPQQVMKQWR